MFKNFQFSKKLLSYENSRKKIPIEIEFTNSVDMVSLTGIQASHIKARCLALYKFARGFRWVINGRERTNR